jgi:hypothetical protein
VVDPVKTIFAPGISSPVETSLTFPVTLSGCAISDPTAKKIKTSTITSLAIEKSKYFFISGSFRTSYFSISY